MNLDLFCDNEMFEQVFMIAFFKAVQSFALYSLFHYYLLILFFQGFL